MKDSKNSLEKITQACKYLLQNGFNLNLSNILDKRISSETQNKFDFGYYPDVDNLSLLLNLIDKSDLVENNLIYTKIINDSLYPREVDYSYFQNYEMIMPYKNQYGEAVGLVTRTLISEEERKEKNIAKYMNTKDLKKSNYLFGLYENKEIITNRGFAYIVEGQFDVIKAYENNIRNVVALGSSNMSYKQVALIKRYCNKIYLLLDNDDAGEIGRNKIFEKYSKYINIKNSYIPAKYKDLDEYLNHHPKEINIKCCL